MTKAVIYARFSDRPDAETSQSIESQLSACREYCASRGWEIAGEYSDAALSGKNNDRVGVWAAINALPRDGVLVVRALDRLSRSLIHFTQIWSAIQGCGADFVSITQQFDTTTAAGRAMLGVLVVFSEYERESIVDRTRSSMRVRQAAGEVMTAKPPFGWEIDPDSPKNKWGNPGRMRECVREQAIIAKIRGLGELCKKPTILADELNKMGLLTRAGRPWNSNTIQNVLVRMGLRKAWRRGLRRKIMVRA